MSQATAGPGFILGVDVSGGGVYTTIAEVLDIAGPSITVKVVDVTNQSSPNQFAEKLATVKEGGDCTFDVNFIPGDPTHNSTTGLLAILNSRLVEAWQIQFGQSGRFIRWSGLVTKWAPKFPVEKASTASISITVTGPVTIV